MEKLSLEKLKIIQIQILKKFVSFCEDNNIKYFLTYGTLLGAARHSGYIPWDDDIDVGMLRADYEKFTSSFNDTSGIYKLKCIETDKNFYCPYAKLMDTRTVLIEPAEDGVKSCVNIDIFPYDNMPKGKIRKKALWAMLDFYQKIYDYQNTREFDENNKIKLIFKKMFHRFARSVSSYRVLKAISKNAMRYKNKKTERVANLTIQNYATCPASAFSDYTTLTFEREDYLVPVGYEQLLCETYGDWRKLPPEEKRVSHHSFVAWKK